MAISLLQAQRKYGLLVFGMSFFILLFSCGQMAQNEKDLEESVTGQGISWAMHNISDDYLIANSMSPADVDGDGEEDYAVIDEWLGIQTILFTPKEKDSLRKPWKRVNLGVTGNPEYSSLGDMDGDGNLDFIVVTGDDLEKGLETGMGIFWGPSAEKVLDSKAWVNAGNIPSTLGQQYLYVETHDINNDGALDILVGGRRNALSGEYSGLRWITAPSDSEDRRDLTKWKSKYIDKAAYSGHGFVMHDVNGDGYKDILLANADWDTPAFEEDLAWYENPGLETSGEIEQEWQKHIIWKSPSFYQKPQIALGDLNGDGLADLATQTQNYIHLFLRKSKNEVSWQQIDVKKAEMVQWIGRPIKIADMNNDGKNDIVAMLIHNDGKIPKDKASVFWMEYKDELPTSDNWTFHPIKWSDGRNSYNQWIGEKWDHCIIKDLDEDGDMDIIGNVEEHYYYTEGVEIPSSYFSVVWFENELSKASMNNQKQTE